MGIVLTSSGIISDHFWDYSGHIMGTFWDRSGSILGSFWDHSGIISGQFAIILESFPVIFTAEGFKDYIKLTGKLSMVMFLKNGAKMGSEFYIGRRFSDLWKCECLQYIKTFGLEHPRQANVEQKNMPNKMLERNNTVFVACFCCLLGRGHQILQD